MGTHYEGMDATDVFVSFVSPLNEIGDGEFTVAGQYALCIGTTIISGSPNEIARVIGDIAAVGRRIEEHSRAPLTHADFSTDEDGFYVCPIDGETFEPGQYGDLPALIQAIDAEIEGHNRERENARA